MKLLIDFESRSRSDLMSVGQHIYATHPSTEVMCLGWKVIGEKSAQVLTMPQLYAHDGTKEFLYAVKHAEHFVAHNAAFEQAIWNKCLVPTTKVGARLPLTTPEKWVCTLSYCSVLNLPRALEKAANALKLTSKKDVEGRRLLLQMCKPRRPINDLLKWIEWVETDDALKRLYKYCEQDLWAEEELYLRLNKYKPFTQSERALWVLDQKINQRGFQIDQKLVARIMSMIKLQETHLHKELQLHTFGWVKTPKQVKNFRAFLEDQGFSIPNLQAKTVDQALKDIDHNPKNANVIRVLKIRQELGKSSTSKYEAFKNRCDEDDGRIRDNLLFHGASTGRWSGVGVQPQNFPRGTIKITQDVLKDIMTCDLDELRMLYGNPSELFSSALRSVITASDGKELFCADFSSIEARVLLWVAGDTNGLKEYEAGLDTYLTMAGTIYQMNWKIIEAEYLKEGYSEKRQIGKKVILACFERSTKVLTQRGWVQIVDVRPSDKLWDGVEWVDHGGVICQGEQKTINMFGVNVTPDHKILTPKGWIEAFQVQKENMKFLKSVISLANLSSEKLSEVKGAVSLQLWFHVLVVIKENIAYTLQTFLIKKVQGAIHVQKNHRRTQENYISSMLRSFPTTNTGGVYLTESVQSFQDAEQKLHNILDIMGDVGSKFTLFGKKIVRLFYVTLSVLKVGTNLNLKLIESMSTKVIFPGIFVLQQGIKIWRTVGLFGTLKKESKNLKTVYDVANVGHRNRFTILTNIGPMVVHNCGYQMGLKKFIQTCRDEGINLPDSVLTRAHAAFKQKYPKVPEVWSRYEKAAIYAVLNKGKKITVNKVTWFVEGEFLFAELPSGRRLAYYGPQIKNEETPWGEIRPKLYHWTVDSKTKQWVCRATYGGMLTENIVQAISRDCMVEAMVRCEDSGFECLITVHDENLSEIKIGDGSMENFKNLMSIRPKWGQDIPLKVGAWQDWRYKK